MMSSAFDKTNTLAKKNSYPLSPISKGDGTTVATERDQDLTGGQSMH